MKKFFLISLIFLTGIVLAHQNYPTDVEEVLQKAGKNRSELEKVIAHYSARPQDSLKLKAAFFLIGNMGEQFYSHYIVADSTGRDMHFNVLDYPNYKKMVQAWDSLEAIYGSIENKRDSVAYDYNVMTAKFLITNIDLAFKAWKKFDWNDQLNFDEFCEYILPYRGSNEPLENWREYFWQKYQWVADSVKDKTDPVEACAIINTDLRSWFKFDSRFYRQSTDQGLSDMLKNKMGRCEDMTNLAIYAMRAMGIPVTSDFTPYWAKTGNNHAWNTVIDKTNKPIIFMGGGANPREYNLSHDLAKVYRKTFGKQKNSLPEVAPAGEELPHYINRNNIIDVTKDYVSVADVSLKLQKPKPEGVNFAYIAVFNTGEWKAINWSKIMNGDSVLFKAMGKDIAYLPGYYKDGKVIPAAEAFILTKEGKVEFLTPDTLKKQTIKLFSTTRKVTRNATDDVEKAYFTKGKTYELFYWDYGWKSLGKQVAGEGALVFKDVPSNALYWCKAEKSRLDERIFTIDKNGKQIWW